MPQETLGTIRNAVGRNEGSPRAGQPGHRAESGAQSRAQAAPAPPRCQATPAPFTRRSPARPALRRGRGQLSPAPLLPASCRAGRAGRARAAAQGRGEAHLLARTFPSALRDTAPSFKMADRGVLRRSAHAPGPAASAAIGRWGRAVASGGRGGEGRAAGCARRSCGRSARSSAAPGSSSGPRRSAIRRPFPAPRGSPCSAAGGGPRGLG